MSRHEIIAEISSTLEQLSEERLRQMAELAKSWTRPTVFSTLSPEDRAEIDAALDELDRGERIPGEVVFAEARQRIAAAKAGN